MPPKRPIPKARPQRPPSARQNEGPIFDTSLLVAPRQKRTLAEIRALVRREFEQRARNRRRIQFKPRPYKLFNLRDSLFNATGDADLERYDIMDIFERLSRERRGDVSVLSLKGGRFTEYARYNAKGLIPFRGQGEPNQIQIQFVVQDKNYVANIFDNGSVRFSGYDAERAQIWLEQFTGPIKNVVLSNWAGSVQVDKKLVLDRFPAEFVVPGIEVLTETQKGGVYVRLISHKTVEVPDKRIQIPKIRHRVQEVTVHLEEERPEKRTRLVEKKTTVINYVFRESGLIQFQGKFVKNIDQVIIFLRYLMDQLSRAALEPLEKEYAPRPKAVSKERSTAKNPPDPPGSFNGKCQPGMYVRPNAQGFPSCYKVPKITASSRRTVIEAYKKAGQEIPERVRALFDIKTQVETKQKVPLRVERQVYAPVLQAPRAEYVLMIGKRQAGRMTEDELEAVARRAGIPDVRKGMGKATMIGRIAAHVEEEEAHPSFVLDGTRYSVEGEYIKGAKRRNGKPNPPRKCATLPLDTLKRYAEALGVDTARKTRVALCKEMASIKR
jgi:ribosomal protein S4